MVGQHPPERSQSRRLYERAQASIPGGASRQNLLFEPHPFYVAEAEGAWLTDVDGNRYLDANNNFTSIIMGHADPVIEAAVTEQMRRGTAYSMAAEVEVDLAELLCERIDSMDQVRFCNSGTEAVMGAIKAARAFTGRPAIVKVEGSYHGTYDHAEASLEPDPAAWGDAAAPITMAYAKGTPQSLADEVHVIAFNDPDGAREVIAQVGERCAAVLLDVMPSRVGFPDLDPAFATAVREAADAVGALLILDEVITFRLASGGAQAQHAITPDLTTLAKIIGGGFPVGAIGGRADVMSVFAKQGGDRAAVPSGGTYTANPITMTAGLACMRQLDDKTFDHLDAIGDATRNGLQTAFATAGASWQVTGAGSLFRIHPHERPVRSYRDARHTSDDAAVMARLQQELFNREVYLSSYGMGCWNAATSLADIDLFVAAVSDALGTLTNAG